MSKVDETRKMWSEKFDSFDTSGNGELTVNELKAALVGMGANLTDQEIVVSFCNTITMHIFFILASIFSTFAKLSK